MDPLICVICSEPLAESKVAVVELREKGSVGVNKASKERGDSICTVPGQKLHQPCRRDYCNPKRIALAKQATEEYATPARQPVLRSGRKPFNFLDDCLFCGTPTASTEYGNSSGWEVFQVTTLEFKAKVLASCKQRNDEWADAVQRRVESVHDLPAAEAVYHQTCSVNFRTLKQMPRQFNDEPSAKKLKVGRKQDKKRLLAFENVANQLREYDDEQTTITDLIKKMENHLEGSGSEAYGRTYMKEQLKAHFGDEILITEVNGLPNVVTLRSTAATVLHQFYSSKRDEDPDIQKKKIIATAAKLILSDIKAETVDNSHYPGSSNIQNLQTCLDFLPSSLKLLLEGIVCGKTAGLKVASIGQAIMQAARPVLLIAPLQLSLGVQLHHQFASRVLIDSLYKHGFCCSYSEVLKFEKNAAMAHQVHIPNFNDEFVQYVADNVDHNSRTLDGNDTFHGMGMIATITPATTQSITIPRNVISLSDIASAGQVKIVYPKADAGNKSQLQYDKLCDFAVKDPTEELNLLWKSSLLFDVSRPSWSGYMQHICDSDHPGKSCVKFLPMIDMSSSDTTCIYSTLKFIAEHAKKHHVTPIVTFDQPLWWKALNIVKREPHDSELSDVILRLGPFHLEMSFVGSIGHLMAGSGLKELLCTIYASNAVDHMMTGKAISRAVRAHMLLDAALSTVIVSAALGVPIPLSREDGNLSLESSSCSPSGESSADLIELHHLYDQLMSGKLNPIDVCASPAMTRLKAAVNLWVLRMQGQRTAQLWLQYLEMVAILRKLIKAERTGNWGLHLQATFDMLPYLAASGHNLYTESGWIYLQEMNNLQVHHPTVYQKFQDGFHVVRRSEREWAGLSTDLIIEQVLMRSMKTSGGLTRGRGMTEQQRSVWLLSMPACAEYNKSMLDLTDVNFNTSEQNKDLSVARQKRDMKDISVLISILVERNPFCLDKELINIMNGVTAGASVTVDTSREVGLQILNSMEGKEVSDFTFKRSKQAVTLDAKTLPQVDGEVIRVDPLLLFQRLVIASRSLESIEEMFRYELCSYPCALFESFELTRAAQKPALADAIWSKTNASDSGTNFNIDTQFVLDGGAWLHSVPCPKGCPTYGDICRVYCNYVTTRYGTPIIVFDGYTNPSTKDMTQQRRTSGKTSTTVIFTDEMTVSFKKENFLGNSKNKQAFVHLLGKYLGEAKCKIYHADGDADLLIVLKAVESAETKATTLVGDDTDLLVLLLYHADMASHDIFFCPKPKQASSKNRQWNIKFVKTQLGTLVCDNILFIHAILGCDTTSRVHGIGKGVALQKFITNSHLQNQSAVFMSKNSTREEIVKAGEKAIVCLLKGSPQQSLDQMRYGKYMEKVATSTTQIQPQSLPPTSAATVYHSLRTYLQVHVWMDGTLSLLSPDEWGWRHTGQRYVPVMTHLPAAPSDLLKVIRCNCTTDCSNLRCSCRKHGLLCSVACGHCHGLHCTNSETVDYDSLDFSTQ